MNKILQPGDYIVFLTYFFIVAAYGWWIYKSKKSAQASSRDYFLAEGSLTWWAIGASLIASNISAEQFIGMSGEGFFSGIAIAAYEWIAAISLIIIAIWFMPVYLKNKIYTMPQFLKQRYNESVAVIMAVFWLFLYVFVNLTSILYLGSKAISGLAGAENFHYIIIGLGIICFCYSHRGYESDRLYRCDTGSRINHRRIGSSLYCTELSVDKVVNNGNNAFNGFKH